MNPLFSYIVSQLKRYNRQAEEGQALSEYALIIATAGIVLIFVMGAIVSATGQQFREAACDLVNDGSDVARCGDVSSITEPDRPPVAIILEPDCIVNEDCSFVDTNASYDPDGDEDNMTCEWEFEDITGTSSLCEPTDVIPNWSETGFKQVTLSVTDEQGLTNSRTVSVEVSLDGPNQPPIGTISGSSICVVGQSCGLFEFVESGTPDEHTPLRFEWSAEDGTIMANDEFASATNIIFNQAGTNKEVVVTVTDNLGAENTFDMLVSEVYPSGTGGGNPPAENPTAQIDNSSPVTCTVNVACGIFDGSGSTDPDGDTPLTYRWSVEGANGAANPTDTTGANQTDITFTQEGTWAVQLVVVDSEGNSSNADTYDVTVEADNPGSGFTIEGQTPANNAPSQGNSVTNFNVLVETENPNTDVTLRFYVTRENAADTYIFNASPNDVQVNGPTQEASNTNLYYHTLTFQTNGSGQKNINGTVNHSNPGSTDPTNDPWVEDFQPHSQGFQPIDSVVAYVNGSSTPVAGSVPNAPTANFLVDTPTNECTAGQLCDFMDSSTGSINQYEWDFQNDNNANPDRTGQNVQWTYNTPGNYTVFYRVTDNQSIKHWMTRQITVNAAQQNNAPHSFGIELYDENTCENNYNCNFGINPWPQDDENDTPFTFNWNFGDGNTASGNNPPAHTYATGGTYTVTLTVTDSRGASASETREITLVDASANDIRVTDVQVTTTALPDNKWQVDNFGFTVRDGTGAPLQGMTYQGDFNGHYSFCETDANGYCDIGPARQWSGGPIEELNNNASVDFQFTGYYGVNGKNHIHANNEDGTPENHVSVNGNTITITKP